MIRNSEVEHMLPPYTTKRNHHSSSICLTPPIRISFVSQRTPISPALNSPTGLETRTENRQSAFFLSFMDLLL
ncbi:hypothetical protein NPIL_574601 [Nephila pilipes]|uniref:Uncharacterized protein n=1 Tax=Nephila pilipes TaxID=299642 RepID=A0A8X6MT55_NEPPI|nr:hypothetical protein NPIL_574601 [Nephila pilipes]